MRTVPSANQDRVVECASLTHTRANLGQPSAVKLQITVGQGRADSASKHASPVKDL